jgi:homocysteine S-methyltransferase
MHMLPDLLHDEERKVWDTHSEGRVIFIGSFSEVEKCLKPLKINGRGERIRTSDPLVPNQVLYQAEPLPELALQLVHPHPLMPGCRTREECTSVSVPEKRPALALRIAELMPKRDAIGAASKSCGNRPRPSLANNAFGVRRYHRCMRPRDQLRFGAARLLDGGMASEFEFLGADITRPLWSAHVLEDSPESVIAVHRSYLEAGADVLLTASYQVSRMGYAEVGLDPSRADRALLRSVELACAAHAEFPVRGILVAASLGPYGAALHNGSEYHGHYDCTFADLVQFHQERIAILAESEADLLAFETLPSLDEARAIGEALKPWPEIAVWFSFTCPDAEPCHRAANLKVARGEALRDCAALAAGFPQTVAVGVNCTQPVWIASLIAELRQASSKPIVVYPNSGEGWDAEARCWIETPGSSDPEYFGQLARQWHAAGAQLVGGCCRTRPAHIRHIAEAIRDSDPRRA